LVSLAASDVSDFIDITLASDCAVDYATCDFVMSGSSTCTPDAPFSALYATMTGTSVVTNIVTLSPTVLAYFCLQCDTNDAATNGGKAFSNPFQMQVAGCYSKVTVNSPPGPYDVSIPLTTAENSATHEVFDGSLYFSTIDNSNCAMTIELWVVSPDAQWSGSQYTITSDGTLQVDTTAAPATETLYIKVVAGQSGGFSQFTSSFVVTTACDLGYTLTSAVAATTPQRININQANSVGFILPTYTSSNTVCPVSTFDVSSTNDPTYTAMGTLTYDGVNSVVRPTVTSTHTDYTFYLRGSAGTTYAWAGPFELYVGCTVNAVESTTD